VACGFELLPCVVEFLGESLDRGVQVLDMVLVRVQERLCLDALRLGFAVVGLDLLRSGPQLCPTALQLLLSV
jgi:hypothetical protein